ncbi:DUF6327 family protein [Flavobacterium sp.]|uniref:DUF6327 family protein n=1 Tax=Flavobacterium sp. TaxID=239 RepID=UPI003788FB60
METKKYSSYEQIELELKILKLEKELSFQKMILNVNKVKEELSPQNIVGEVVGSYKSILSKTYGMILRNTIPILINWLSKKKRGN